jgi:hypothetical protein
MTGPMIIEKTKAFCDEVSIYDECTFSETVTKRCL